MCTLYLLCLNISSKSPLVTSKRTNGCFSETAFLAKVSRDEKSTDETFLRNAISRLHNRGHRHTDPLPSHSRNRLQLEDRYTSDNHNVLHKLPPEREQKNAKRPFKLAKRSFNEACTTFLPSSVSKSNNWRLQLFSNGRVKSKRTPSTY